GQEVPSLPSGGPVTCPSCGTAVPVEAIRGDLPTVLPVTAKDRVPPLSAAPRPVSGTVPWYLVALALVPLVVPAVAIPLHLLIGGVAGVVLWSSAGAVLAAACLAVLSRRRWSRTGRVLGAFGL